MEFLYENVTDENRGYNVTAYPMTDGYPTPYLAVNGAKSESYSSTYDECVMNILGGNQIYVDSVLIIVEDFEEEKEYGRFMIPLGASFGQVRIDDVYFDIVAWDATDEYRPRGGRWEWEIETLQDEGFSPIDLITFKKRL